MSAFMANILNYSIPKGKLKNRLLSFNVRTGATTKFTPQHLPLTQTTFAAKSNL
jgi:hypothetical protein